MSASERIPAVVLSGHTMALGVVRALGEAGVPVWVLHHDDRDMAHVSRHVVGELRVPPPHEDEAGFVEAVLRQADRFPGAVLLPASDESAVAASRHKAELERHFRVGCPPFEVTRNFIEKSRTYALAARAGVGVPATVQARSVEEAVEGARALAYPLLVKPSQSHLFHARFRVKMVVVRDADALAARVAECLAAGLEVMVQEIVPGPDSDVVNYNAYAVGGRSLVEFTARQLRKAPPRLGSPRVVRSERIPEVREAGRATLQALGFEGFACCEFKRDARDGTFRVVDVNGRHNLSTLLAVRCGINFPLIHYRHLLHGELPEDPGFAEGVYWTDFYRDLGYSVLHLPEEHLWPWAYLAPYLGRHCDATFDLHDLGPFLARGRSLGRQLLRRALG